MLLLADVIVKLIQILWLNRLICFDLHSQFLLTYTFYLKLFLFNVFLRKSWYKHSKVTTLYSIHCEYQIKMYILLSETRFCKKKIETNFLSFWKFVDQNNSKESWENRSFFYHADFDIRMWPVVFLSTNLFSFYSYLERITVLKCRLRCGNISCCLFVCWHSD